MADYIKAPSEDLDYTVDYTPELQGTGDVIVGSMWIIPSLTTDAPDEPVVLKYGVRPDFENLTPQYTLAGIVVNQLLTTIFLSGGDYGQVFTVMNRVVTNAGRIISRTDTISIVNRPSTPS